MVAIVVGCAIIFNIGILIFFGKEYALQFLGGYLIEFSLSMDNLFVFISIFTAFAVPLEYQHRCLKWGIICAIILRFIFISLGITIVESFSWILYIFGAVLIISGIKMCRNKAEHKDVKNSLGIKVLGKFMPITDEYDGHNFITKKDGKRYATPLLAVLFVIEFSDILFAIDSVPAVFSVSTNIFIVYSSTIFAILGLRELYFVLEHLQSRFRYVKYGVAVILMFTGVKLLGLIFDFHISILASISIIFSILALAIILSLIVTKRQAQKAAKDQPADPDKTPENNRQ